MRYLAFAGVIGTGAFVPGGWHDAIGGGDALDDVKAAAEEHAEAELARFTNPDVRYYVRCWWNVADAETGTIVAEGEVHPHKESAAPGWLQKKRSA